ncbi:MAG: GNAT family N-acetyltransferase [Lentisphaeria bacterium]|nr:GNAT family N-acetyltransferase [Lentisphaeria bacterium]
MAIRRADDADREALAQIRYEFVQSKQQQISPEKERQLKKRLSEYFQKHLNRDCFGYLAEENGEIAAVALLVVFEKPANLHFPTGKTGLVMNVYTRPAYRRRGLATDVLRLMIEDAKKLGLSYLELGATEQGAPVYRKLGFGAETSGLLAMELKLPGE